MRTLIRRCHFEISITYIFEGISKTEISLALSVAIPSPSSLIIAFELHIRNPTYTPVSKRPINHRDTRINVSYRPRPGNVIIWKLMASGLLGPSGGCMRVGSLRWIFTPNAQRIYRERNGDPSIWDGALRIRLSSMGKDD